MQEYRKKPYDWVILCPLLRITPLTISNDEMKDITKIVKSLEDSGLLLKGVSKTVQNETK